MPYQLSETTTFGVTFDTAYAAITSMNWSGGDVMVGIGIYANKAAHDAGAQPLRTFSTTVPAAQGTDFLTAVNSYIETQAAAGAIAELAQATKVD